MLLDFFDSAINLKRTTRQGWVNRLSLNNPESVADHTFMMSVMGMAVSDLEDYDTAKVLKMILLHDLAEAETGDMVPGQIDRDEKSRLENDAISKILEMLPAPLSDHYLEIWQEYAKHKTRESILVHQIDKLEMALQAKKYEQQGHPKSKLAPFYDTAKAEVKDPTLRAILAGITEE